MGDDGHSRRPQKASKNSENSFVQSFKTDWQMFWHGLVGEEDETAEPQDPFQTGRLSALTLEQVRELTKVLSSDRKKLNQRMESIQKDIELSNAKLESSRLVGGDVEDTLTRLNQLSDLGQNMSTELSKLNDKLKLARRREDSIRKGVV